MATQATFEVKRSGVIHRYSITAQGIDYFARRPTAAGASFGRKYLWKDAIRLEASRRHLGIRFKTGRFRRELLPIYLGPDDGSAFLTAAFDSWAKVDQGAAIKGALDYAEDRRTRAWTGIALSLFFPGLLALLLLADGLSTLHCSQVLQREGVLTNAQVNKVKKDRRGSFVWSLEFTTATGVHVKGKRASFAETAAEAEVKSAPVVYAPHDPKCWDISMRKDAPALNQNQRLFTQTMTMGFGASFAALCLIGVLAGLIRLVFRQPHRDDLTRIGHQLGTRASANQ